MENMLDYLRIFSMKRGSQIFMMDILVLVLLCSMQLSEAVSFSDQKSWSQNSEPAHAAPAVSRRALSFSAQGDVFNLNPRNGSINGTVYKGQVYAGSEDLYQFSYTEMHNRTTAVRIHMSAHNATENYPVLVVVRQQRHILSWQMPLIFENIFDYYSVSRTLCPLEVEHRVEPQQVATFLIDISSASKTKRDYTLSATFVQHFDLQLDKWTTEEITPSEPKYYQYRFQGDEASLVIKVESDDELCSVVSVQDVQCPVFDLVRNVEFTGEYQTLTRKGAITVTKDEFKSKAFFVVLLVKPDDYDCSGVSTIATPPGVPQPPRKKTMRIKIERSISQDQYLGAILGAMAWFLVFFVAAAVISVIYHVSDGAAEYLEPIPVTARSGGSTPQTPIIGSEASSSYGATAGGATGTSGMGQGAGNQPGSLDMSKSSNGIPHRIAPQHEHSDEEEINTAAPPGAGYDMLHDANIEKDVFRTKTLLYVADLARKDRRILNKRYKLYPWNLFTLAIFYGLPVIQLVITYQTVLHVTGNEDICYYNFYCTHPLGVLSAFNNVFSNIGYVMLGLLFLLLVLRRDIMYKKAIRKNERLEKNFGIPQHFGLFYALGIALIMEGVLSGCYHVCPSYSNFQFDTSFMYMIGWLCMLKIYQTRHPDINPQAHVAYFCAALVIFLAVVGVVYGSPFFWVVFAFVQILCTLILSAQIYYMGRWKLDIGVFHRLCLILRSDLFHCAKPMYTDRMILLVIGNAVNWSFAIYGMIMEPRDFASYLLAIFIVNLLMYFAFYIIMKLRCKERILPVPMLFIICTAVVWGFAFYFFLAKLTSWQITPAQSREGNKPCILFNFYDDHDVWHFLSSMALFFSFMVLMTLDDDLIHTRRDQIQVF